MYICNVACVLYKSNNPPNLCTCKVPEWSKESDIKELAWLESGTLNGCNLQETAADEWSPGVIALYEWHKTIDILYIYGNWVVRNSCTLVTRTKPACLCQSHFSTYCTYCNPAKHSLMPYKPLSVMASLALHGALIKTLTALRPHGGNFTQEKRIENALLRWSGIILNTRICTLCLDRTAIFISHFVWLRTYVD